MSMREILDRVAKGEISTKEAEHLLRLNGVEEIEEFAKLDVDRENRKGIPEIILAEGKEPTQVLKIARRLLEARGRVILSRVSPNHLKLLRQLKTKSASWKQTPSGLLVVKQSSFRTPSTSGRVGVLTAGTSDIQIAEEAKIVAEEMGCKVFMENDVGVAGIHRVFPAVRRLSRARVDVLIVAAGREGALPTVVAGLVDLPVIGLPVSTGYGAGGQGKAALLAMLQACSLGIAVVNIDGGVAAGALAALIANRVARFRGKTSAK
jgi:pyridinium-3,5-biscarboxylic acid mononucleotide synthase